MASLCHGDINMHIALYGATGKSGSRILTELLSRGHQVTAIVRDPAKLAAQPGLTVVEGDVSSASAIAAKIKGVDAVVSAYGPPPAGRQLVMNHEPQTAPMMRRTH